MNGEHDPADDGAAHVVEDAEGDEEYSGEGDESEEVGTVGREVAEGGVGDGVEWIEGWEDVTVEGGLREKEEAEKRLQVGGVVRVEVVGSR